MDNCTAHPEIKGLKSITVGYFPPNVTSILQPLDQGVIMSFKRNYRKLPLRRIVSALEGEDYEVDILTTLHLSKAAWNDVTEKKNPSRIASVMLVLKSIQKLNLLLK
ncbi:hypothetical protein AVEN_143823-1 [Araneus ventricosus]|uniref:DDE-1 domain-containing protein n=1 Tax=Araneus ventricosus TaxID=182803 RepID=A0A4Y2P4I6_ARAVE|nr:hypothetical protein AVEN_143823-1 [Araneus ventricosus]